MKCQRPGCDQPAPHNKIFCSRRCYGQVNSKFHPKPKRVMEASGEPWWFDAANFYHEARKRFPETGAGNIDRNRVAGWTASGPALHSRMREFKRSSSSRRSSVVGA